MKKVGNEILKSIGGRSVHPVNACVGGFYRWPDPTPLKALLPELEWALEAAQEAVKWAIQLPYPELEMDYEFVALHHPQEYAVMNGEVWSSKGSHLPVSEYEGRYLEEHVKHSNALHSRTKDGAHYLVGPLARLNLNHDQLMPLAQKTLQENKIKLPITNPYKSLIARSVELVHFYEEAIQLIQACDESGPAHKELKLKAGEGAGASEAPRTACSTIATKSTIRAGYSSPGSSHPPPKIFRASSRISSRWPRSSWKCPRNKLRSPPSTWCAPTIPAFPAPPIS